MSEKESEVTLQRPSLLFVTLVAVLLAADVARAEDPPREYMKRLRSPAVVKSLIGGEDHESYVIHARKGQTMTVQISWTLARFDNEKYDTNAQFTVSGWPIFSDDGRVKGAKESNDGKRWTAKIPRTGNYYIYVTGYPTVNYVLRVTVQ
jgi:hypothetical protein